MKHFYHEPQESSLSCLIGYLTLSSPLPSFLFIWLTISLLEISSLCSSSPIVVICNLQETFGKIWTHFLLQLVCKGGTTRIWWLETGDTTKHRIMHRTAHPPHPLSKIPVVMRKKNCLHRSQAWDFFSMQYTLQMPGNKVHFK